MEAKARPESCPTEKLEERTTFLFAAAHFRGLNTGTLPFAPVPNTDRSAGLEHDDNLLIPDSLSLGSSIKLVGPCRLAWPSSCRRDCFLKQNTDQLPFRSQGKQGKPFCLIKLG